MATALYLTALEPDTGRSLVALGLMELLTGQRRRVGYFRPVVAGSAAQDDRLALITGRYRIDADPESLAGVTAAHVQQQQAAGNLEDVFATVLSRYKAMEGDYDVVLVDGADVAAAVDLDVEAALANHLGAGLCPVIGGRGRSADEVVAALHAAYDSLAASRCRVTATFVNRVEPADVAAVREGLATEGGERGPAFVLPETPALARPTVRELVAALDARVVRGQPATDDREVARVVVAATTLGNFLNRLGDASLVITPGDRDDVIVGSLLAQLAPTQPNIAALVLTDGLQPAARVTDLLDDLGEAGAPIVTVASDTPATTAAVTGVRPHIHADDDRKIATALGVVEAHVDRAALMRAVELAPGEVMTPRMFEHLLADRARQRRQRIVLPEAGDERILRAAQLLDRRGVAEPVLLGDVDHVRTRMGQLGLDLEHLTVIDPATTDETDDYAERYHQLRAHYGIELEHAREAMLDPTSFATMMVHVGHADGMVSGAAHTTRHTLGPAVEFIRTRPGSDLVSSVVFMCLPDRVLVFGDCAVNPSPTPVELADIAATSADTATEFGLPARVAMVSQATGLAGLGADVDKVREATKIVRERHRELTVDGPLSYDTAVDGDVAASTAPDSPVAGQATVLIFPDLSTGNGARKEVQRSSGAVAIGPILQGLAKPVNDLSRGCRVADVVNTVAITAVQAQQAERQGPRWPSQERG